MKERYLIIAWPSDHDEDINGHAQDIQDALVDMGDPVIVTDLGSDLTQVLTDHLEGEPRSRLTSTGEFAHDSKQGLLTLEFPKHLEHPARRVNLTAAFLLEYHADKGRIPCYSSVIDGLREGAAEISRVAKPVRPALSKSCAPCGEAGLVKKDRGFV